MYYQSVLLMKAITASLYFNQWNALFALSLCIRNFEWRIQQKSTSGNIDWRWSQSNDMFPLPHFNRTVHLRGEWKQNSWPSLSDFVLYKLNCWLTKLNLIYVSHNTLLGRNLYIGGFVLLHYNDWWKSWETFVFFVSSFNMKRHFFRCI